MSLIKKWKGKTALVTGASSGIGAAFAELLAGEGCNLILTARRLEKLEETASELSGRHEITVKPIRKDLSVAGSAGELVEEIEKLGLEVDLLINNAGVGLSGNFVDGDIDQTLGMIQLNVTSLVELNHLLLPKMIERDSGDILIVGSIAAYVPSPTLAVYSGTKAFVHGMGLALGYELRKTGVNVTVLNPGGTRSEWMETAGISQTNIADMGQMDAKEVAKIGLKAMARGKPFVEPGLMNKAIARAMPLLPMQAQLSISRVLQRAIGGKGG